MLEAKIHKAVECPKELYCDNVVTNLLTGA